MDLEILQIASKDNNQKFLANHTHNSELKNSLCGDEMQIKVIIKKDKIVDFGYQGKCCIYCQASASLLSKISINKNKLKVDEICDDARSYFEGDFEIINKKWKNLGKLFKKKNLSRKECILLPFKALKKIVSD